MTPALPKRKCRTVYCNNLTEATGKGLCPTCRSEADKFRGSSAQRGYDADHRTWRLAVFARDHYRCQDPDCDIPGGFEPDIVRLAREAYEATGEHVHLPTARILKELKYRFADGLRHLDADHVIPISRAPELRLEVSNGRTLCDRCHRRKTVESDGGFGFGY